MAREARPVPGIQFSETTILVDAENRRSFGYLSPSVTDGAKLLTTRRMTRISIPGVYTLQKYPFQEKVLTLCIFLTTLASFALFGFAIWARNDEIGVLMKYMKEDADLALDQSRKMYGNREILTPIMMDEEHAKKTGLTLGRSARLLTDIQLTTVLFMWTTSIAGVLLIYEKNRVITSYFIASNVVNIVTELIVASVFLTQENRLDRGLKAQMVRILKRKYVETSDTAMTRLVNTVMVVGKCCGIQGPHDFKRQAMYEGWGGKMMTYTMHHVPLACCKMEAWGSFVPGSDRKRLHCKESPSNKTMVHRQGCYDAWSKRFIHEAFVPITAITAALCGLQTIQLLIGCSILKFTEFVVSSDYDDGGPRMARSSLSANAAAGRD